MDYRTKIRKRIRNFCFMEDGAVFANYICEGIPVDFFTDGSLDSAAKEHEDLYNHLMSVGSAESFLGGFLTKVPDNDRMQPVVEGVKDLSTEDYPDLTKSMDAYHATLKTNRYPRFRRLYWVSVRLSIGMSAAGRLAAKVWETDPYADVPDNMLLTMDKAIQSRFPDSFNMRIAEPEDLDWVYDRMRLRGVEIPEASLHPRKQRPSVAPGPDGFADIMVHDNPDGEAIIDEFAARFSDDDAPGAKQKLKDYFTSLRSGNFIEVRNPGIGERTPKLPDGPISYQSVFGITRYADANDKSARGFTSLVDQATGLDGDFVHRFRPVDYTSPKDLEKTLENLDAEQKANATSELDTDRYAEMYRDVRSFSEEMGKDSSGAKMRVATFFAFGAPRLDVLTKMIPQVLSKFHRAGYRTYCPTGLVEEMWNAMWPCTTSTSLVDEFCKGTTTARLMAQYAPMRFHRLGDAKGIPLGQDIDDVLGNDVFLDVLNATEEGNGSIAVTGAQGRGKSFFMKVIVGWMADLKKPAYILDGEGEWATYANTLPDSQVIDIVNPTVSLDPLKIMPLKEACDVLATLFLPLLGVDPDTEAGAVLASKFDARWVQSRGFTSTRQVLESIRARPDSVIRDAQAAIQRLLDNRIADAFVDPVVDGRIQVLPPAKITATTVVFYTRGLTLPPQGKVEERMTLQERFGLMANSAVAMITKHMFDQIQGSSMFVLDEAHFFDGLDVLTQMIKEPDRTGRKRGTFVLVGSQTGEELSKPAYKLIRRKLCFGQDTKPNAREALEWADFLASPGLVNDLVKNTTPLNKTRNNKPVKGRAGETYFNDGSSKGKMKVFDQMRTDRRAISDTTASKYVRYDAPKIPQEV